MKLSDRLAHLEPFLRHVRRQWPWVVGAMLLSFLVVGFNLVVPLLFKRLYEILAVDSQLADQERMAVFGRYIAVVMTVFLGRRTCQSLSSFLATRVTQRMAVEVRREVYAHLHGLPMSFFDNQRSGSLVSSVTNDITTLQFLLHDGMVQLFTAPVTVLGAVALVFWLDPFLGAWALLIFPVLYLVLNRSRGKLRDIAMENQEAISRLTIRFLEAVANIRVVRAFQRQAYEIDRFEELNEDCYTLRIHNAALNALVEFLTEITILLGFAVVLWIGGQRIHTGSIHIGDLLALVAYLQTMRSSLQQLSIAYTRYQQAGGATLRLLAILHETPEPALALAPLPADHRWSGRLTLRDLHFAYPDGTPVLAGANLELRPGEKVALVGQSGVGKSTLASLVLGLYRPQAGAVLLDGVDTRTLPPETLLDLISIVPQDVGLFSGSVRENLAYARLDATDEEIEAACRAANADQFIARLPDGYDTFVGDQGVKLSGGQRQRLAIARAILRGSRVLILDEATSHVDPETETLVQEALRRLLADRTALIIAHQESALRGVDRVIELRDQQLVELDRQQVTGDRRQVSQ